MEKRIEELEVRLRIAEARAEVATDLVRELARQLGLSGAINWSEAELISAYRERLGPDELSDPARAFVHLDLGLFAHDGESPGEAYMFDMTARRNLLRKVEEEIKHRRSSRSEDRDD